MATAFAFAVEDTTYSPSNDEPYMCERQLSYFRTKLMAQLNDIHRDAGATLEQLQEHRIVQADPSDRASAETDWNHELRTRDRQRKLIAKIEAALHRIDDGEYGYCEITGDPIGLPRLEARPVATMTVEAQQAHERFERLSRQR